MSDQTSDQMLLTSALAKEVLVCRECQQCFQQPRVLPCQHTFCLECLERHIGSSQADHKKGSRTRLLSTMACPTCQTTCALPLDGVVGFPADLRVLKLQDFIEQVTAQSVLQYRLSESCSESDECCPKCSLMTSEEGEGGEGARSGASSSDDLRAPAPKRPNNSTTSTQTDVRNTGASNSKSFHLRDPPHFSKSSKTMVNENISKLETDGRISGTNNRNSDNNIRREVNLCKNSQLNDTNSSFSIAGKDGLIKNLVEDNCDLSVEDSSESGGSQNGDSERSSGSTTDSGGQLILNDGSTSKALYRPVLIWEEERREHDEPTGVAFTPNGGLAVAEYGNSAILLYSPEGALIRKIENNVKPYSIIVDKDEYVVIGDRKDKTLKIFDQTSGECLSSFDKNTFPWVDGIGMNSRGEYIVFDRTKYKICTYDADGKKLNEFGSSPFLPSSRREPTVDQFCMADFLAVDSRDRVIVCDSGNHCIKVFDEKGSFLFKFGERGKGDGRLEWPKGICVDEKDNILVTDARNKRVSLYSSSGQFLQQLLHCEHPFGVALSKGGGKKDLQRLALTQFSLNGYSRVSVYLLNDYNSSEV